MKAAVLWLVAATALLGQARVPFVGCPQGGQLGPQGTPRGKDPALPISADAARRLAYYAAFQLGVLAPRGWYCFGTAGSGGYTLSVSPEPFDMFAKGWNGFSGPGIDIELHDSGAFGRFAVASLVARVFPTQWAFARKISSGTPAPANDFVFEPYPTDKLTHKGDRLVEFETPPQAEGLGTQSFLKRAADPIRGVAILLPGTGGPNVLLLAVRLPRDLEDLTPVIIQQVERDAQKGAK